MHKLWLIIKREYITRVKTKGFVIGTLIVPLVGIGFTLFIVYLVGHQSSQAMRISIVDNAGGIAPVPLRLARSEAALLGAAVTAATIAEAARQATAGARPLPMTGYKLDLLSGVVHDLLERLAA